MSLEFDEILSEMKELYLKKNADYGNSFGDAIQKFGYPTAIARIYDKYNRVEKMVLGEKMNIQESLRDNLIDIANYCILTVIELDKDLKHKNKSENV